MSVVIKTQRCDTCQKVFGTNSRKREYRRRIVDPVTNKALVVCNACGLLLRRARWKSGNNNIKQLKALSTDSVDTWDDVASFVAALKTALQDDSVVRLYCPVVTPKVCSCIQRYVTDSKSNTGVTLPNRSEDLINKTKAIDLNALHKKAKELVKMKVPRPKNQNLTVNEIRGVIHLRTKEYEDFVLQNRINLKCNYHLCERAIQRVLCYSNNYLHKQLKTLPNGEARITAKSALAAKHLPELKTIGLSKCCRNKCTRLAVTHERLVEEWRCRALGGRKDARTVLGEMLTLVSGGEVTCFKFLQLVTGCTENFYRRVKRDMKTSDCIRDPPEHGLRAYWRRKKLEINSNQNTNRLVTHPSVITRNVNISKDTIPIDSSVMSECMFDNSVVGLNDRNEIPLTTSNSVSVINSTKNVINSSIEKSKINEILDNSLNEVVPSLLNNIGYIDSYSDEMHNSCLQSGRGDLLTLNLLPSSDATCSVSGTEESADRIQVLPSDVASSVKVVEPIRNDSGSTTLDASSTGSENVQYIEITKLSDLPGTRDNEEEDALKYVFMIPPDCLLLQMSQS